MSPVSSNSSSNKRSRQSGLIDRSSGLVARTKYCNNLPDIPFDPKFLQFQNDPNRFVSYQQNSLEKKFKLELHTDPGLGVVIDLIDPLTYKIDVNATLHPDDEALLQEEAPKPINSKRLDNHKLNVSWLRRSEYISHEFNRYGTNSSNVETRIGSGVKEILQEEEAYKDRDAQIQAIEKTFEEAKKEITKHHTKPNVHPVEVMPIFPDFKMWQHPAAQVIFDSDPSFNKGTVADQQEQMSQAMIRGMVDEDNEQFVAYFLPTDETRMKRREDQQENLDYDPEFTYDYKLAREYNWNVKNKASKGFDENYFFVFRNEKVYYNELETRVRLSKRRAKLTGGVQQTTNAVLAIAHRPHTDEELHAHHVRRMQLDQLNMDGDDDEEEENDDEEGDENQNKDGEENTEQEKENEFTNSDIDDQGASVNADDEQKMSADQASSSSDDSV